MMYQFGCGILKMVVLKLNYYSETALNFLPWEFDIEKTKTTFIISVLKVICWVVLIFSISNFSINKNSQGRKLSSKKIPTFGNSALEYVDSWPKILVFRTHHL